MQVVKRIKWLIARWRFWWVQKKVKSQRRLMHQSTYLGTPKVSVILQVFNKRGYVGDLIRRLLDFSIDELIVIDDGSVDGSWQESLPLLKGKNHFIIRSNDLYEVRTYDRALSFARGEYAVLLQDDDMPEALSDWVGQALRLMEMDPLLLILGGRQGLEIMLPDDPSPGVTPEYRETQDLAGCPGVNKFRLHRRPAWVRQGIRFEYVMSINRSPMWVRRRPFMEQVGIDQVFAPFMCDDVDSCLRAWRAGWRVGLYDGRFGKYIPGGMKLFNDGIAKGMIERNWNTVYQRHGELIRKGDLAHQIDILNQQLQVESVTEDLING